MNQTEIEQIGEELYFVAASPSSRRLRTQADLISQVDVPVLIAGEPGSGRTTAARLIHALSIRSGFPFTEVKCAALTPELLDRELLAFEGQTMPRKAERNGDKFKDNDKGTLLLRDLESMSSSVQLRLSELFQRQDLVQSGRNSSIQAAVRVIATINRDELETACADRKIREDLYYQLSVFELNVPPLRDRRDDIPLLLGHFINRLTRRYSVPHPSYSNTLLDACQQYAWPGNLRQLETFVKRFLVFGNERTALAELNSHLDSGIASEQRSRENNGNGYEHAGFHSDDEKSSLKLLVRQAKGEAERNAIVHALEETHWNRKAAARALSISYRALLYKIQEYQLIPHETGVGNVG